MFKVTLVYNTTVIRTVYSVQQLENGLTQFLMFDEYTEKWVWQPSSQYVPYSGETKDKRK
ncbi:hypothetical protein [Paenibacillus sp. GbtcB18]|uniref:hypothetical protein n=1 Tax=Paenibacillus sp. GbtcB18 TaxID=2824763 RepID=UPI001C308A96|nr:hypothetical protein [Paenibacillus sp. GbtcB18]